MSVLGAPVLHGQTPERTLDQGVQAYRELEMESAGWLLRQALASNQLDAPQRKTALSYLGAAELYRDRRDSALAAYAQLIRLDPYGELDALLFGPDVQAVFEEARRLTPIAEISARRTSFAPGERGLPIRLRVNTPHVMVVTAEAVSGAVLDTIFRGRVRQATTVYWDASGPPGARPVGGFVVAVTSLDGRGRARNRTTLPVHVTRSPENALAVPSPPQMLPERQPAGPAFTRLGLGIAAATAAYLVTPLLTDSKAPQIALTAAFGAAGVIGFWEVRPGKPLPENVVANEVAREAWEARVARVQAENRRRSDGGTVTIDVGRAIADSR
jgi:hypothetical protein